MALDVQKAEMLHNLTMAFHAISGLAEMRLDQHPGLKEGKVDKAFEKFHAGQVELAETLANYIAELKEPSANTPPELEKAYQHISLRAKALAEALASPGRLASMFYGDFAPAAAANNMWKSSGCEAKVSSLIFAIENTKALVRTGQKNEDVGFEEVPLTDQSLTMEEVQETAEVVAPQVMSFRQTHSITGLQDSRERSDKKVSSNALRFVQILAVRIAKEVETPQVLMEAGSLEFRKSALKQYENREKGVTEPHFLEEDDFTKILIGAKTVHDYVTVLKAILIDPKILHFKEVPYNESLKKKITKDDTSVTLENLLDSLPGSHVSVLKTVFALIQKVVKNSAANKMTYDSIVNAFGGTVLGFMGLHKIEPVTTLGDITAMGTRDPALHWLKTQVEDPGAMAVFDKVLARKVEKGDYSGVAYQTKTEMDSTAPVAKGGSFRLKGSTHIGKNEPYKPT